MSYLKVLGLTVIGMMDLITSCATSRVSPFAPLLTSFIGEYDIIRGHSMKPPKARVSG
jgi:hypothetical protein